MKKIGDIMSEMGFKKDSNEATQKAFLKYLMRTAVGVEVQKTDQNINVGEQLAFDFTCDQNKTEKAG